MPLVITRVQHNTDFGIRSGYEMSLTLDLAVIGPNPMQEARALFDKMESNTAVMIFAEGEEMPCATDHSEEWPGITDV